MDNEQRLAWLIEHCVLGRIREEIDRVFQRFYYFLVASSFLLSGFAVLVSQRLQGGQEGILQEAVLWVLVGTGTVLSLGFWVINSWNSRIIFNYGDRLRPGGKAWPWAGNAALSLDVGFRTLEYQFDQCLRLKWYIFGGLFVDLVSPDKPAWFARYIPFMLSLVWLALGWVVLCVTIESLFAPWWLMLLLALLPWWLMPLLALLPWWLMPLLALLISGLVALAAVLRPTTPQRSWLEVREHFRTSTASAAGERRTN